MIKKSRQLFYIDSDPEQIISQPSAYIFDQTYKTKLEKNKFERNPKFAYFNALMKIKNKLGTQQHQIYEMLFQREHHEEDHKLRGLTAYNKKFTKTSLGSKTKSFLTQAQNNGSPNQNINGSSTYRNSVQQISFQANARHRRGQSQYYNDRPRLDDIMAQYRRLSRKQKQSPKNMNFRLTSKASEQFSLFNRTGRLLPRQFSQGNRHRRTSKL